MRRASPIILTLAAVCCGASSVAADDPVAAGSPFRLSACTDCRQRLPGVAGRAGGSFLTVWEASNPTVPSGVFGRGFDFAGNPDAPAEFAVEQYQSPPQFEPAVAADRYGNYVVAWQSMESDVSAILAQHIDATGTPRGQMVQVAADPSGSPSSPTDQKAAVAATPDGGFWVAWITMPSTSTDVTPPRVMAQRYDLYSNRVGDPIQLSTGLVLGDRPSLCIDSRGRLVAAWTFIDAFRPFEPSKVGVAARRLSLGNVPIGPEILVAPATATASTAAVSCGRRASFVVTWSADGAEAGSSDVLGQRLSRNGLPLGTPFQVNSQSGKKAHASPAITHDQDGNFVVAWEASNANGRRRVLARRFAPDASALSGELEVWRSANAPLSSRPAVSTTGMDGFVVVWNDPQGLYGQRYTLSTP